MPLIFSHPILYCINIECSRKEEAVCVKRGGCKNKGERERIWFLFLLIDGHQFSSSISSYSSILFARIQELISVCALYLVVWNFYLFVLTAIEGASNLKSMMMMQVEAIRHQYVVKCFDEWRAIDLILLGVSW
jgi:hypothetical protein